MNNTLQQQIESLSRGMTIPGELRELFQAISDTYDQKDAAIHQATEDKKQLRKIQEIARVGYWEADLTVEDMYNADCIWSDEIYEQMGLKPGTMRPTYNNLISLIHPDDVALMNETVAKAMTSGQRFITEYRVTGPDGSTRILGGVGEFLFTDSGAPAKIMGIVQDVTEKRTTEAALDRANRDLKILFDNMEEVFFSAKINERKDIHLSPGSERLHGYSCADFNADPDLWEKMVFEEDRFVFERAMRNLVKGQRAVEEYRVYQKNGSLKWIEVRMSPTLDGSGRLVRVDGMIADISKRKQAELTIVNNEKRFRALLENSADAITISDSDYKFVFLSDSVKTITGFEKEEFYKKTIFDCVHPEEFPVLENTIRLMSEKPGVPIPFIIRFIKKDGSWIWIEGFVCNLLNDGAVKGYVANFRDISERMQFQEALKATNESLSKSNSELDRFVYSVSHDLRAPLASILGAIEYACSETNDKNLLDTLGMMKTAAQKLDVFILDILDYSRNTRMEIRSEEIDFRSLVNEVKNNLKFMNAGKGDVELRTSIEQGGSFCSDGGRVSMILNNLVSNSIRYYNPNAEHPYVHVLTRSDDSGVHIEVEDNGLGIDPKFHGKIFDMFYRVSKKSNGSGLGLYIVKEAVEKLGGKLSLLSEPGKGTTFKIFLPNLFTTNNN